MERSIVSNSKVGLAAVVGLLLGATACETVPGPEQLGDDTQFATGLSMSELTNTLVAESQRVEVTLYREGIVVRELEIKSAQALRADERVAGRILGVGRTEGGGYIELNIEGLRIGFTGETRFTAREGEVELDLEAFVARVTGALAEGARPAVEAVRSPPDAPQAPDNERFVARHIKLLGEGEGRILEMNIDADNLRREESPPPDGWIALLGREFELRIREGITHLERERPDLVKQHFEGLVESVYLERHAFKIKNGPLVRLLPGETEIRYQEGDEHRLGSLDAVARALDAGLRVFTAGVGVVERREPLELIAIAVVFEIVPPPMREFEGVIESVDLIDSTVTLTEGLVIRIAAETQVRFESNQTHLLGSLEAVAEAVEEGRTVVAAGVGHVVNEDPVVIEAVKIIFVVRPPPLVEFRGEVESVDLQDSIVALTNGTKVGVKADTEILFSAGEQHWLGSLKAVAEALAAGRKVLAAGVGEVASVEPRVICAKKILFILEPPDLIAFQGVVRSVDLERHTFTLENGTVVRVNDQTVVWFSENDIHALRTLAAVAEAIGAGRTVVAAGLGRPDEPSVANTAGPRLLAVKVAFFVVPPGIQHFEGTVTAVDIDARSFTLDGSLTVRVVEGTMIVHESGNESVGSLDVVAEIVRAGGRVRAAGMGLLETSEPLVLIAITVVFRV